MKKLLLLVGLLIVFSFGLTACGSSDDSTEKKVTNKESAKETKKSTDVVFPEKELGQGKIILKTESGSSENGNIPFMYKDDDLLTPSIGFEAWEFDGSKLTYIYIDDVLNSEEQLANTQTSLDLTTSDYETGVHEVKTVQFDNDKETGKIITYKTAKYEIKPK
ncbi:TPA: hypothetical protein ACSYWY_12585 [Listeria monocytogenes]|nr:hypothetical protein [Listeria monocytogenes]EAC5187395.1 hypothetical protein [Listeria monocytogenes]EAC7895674.1 hypothetical protein [Listeria monocytogenes]EAE1722952.1 hypothetical protein [Listeria monocytogenes]EAF2425451.1 hypothetical protein [Listeria monocytogenes]